ncbi:Na+/H+ antiporter NhaC family protein [Virgibacillus halodenitrificans]|uniref:Na+/H+ antiporter NhaC family protein n=1 Tax=Virgibacillus halodenitrificans TaxID=1482 RepID=UPI000316497C|nr:Na+/H+ antiporter NhaC family protein [Virgibacillus halodenitrificans]
MDNNTLEFKGGWGMSLVPVLVFFVFCILLFVVFLSYDMHALAMGGFLGILIGSWFAKDSKTYWNSVIKGIASPNSITIVLILFVVGMFTEMIKDSGLSEGFIWIASQIGITGGMFVAFTFITCCIVATATGSSIGTMFVAYPIFFVAGTELGCDPILLAGAITSGCIFGDNLAPVSDTTVASASTQLYKDRKTAADIAGVVSSRFRYSIVAGIVTVMIFAILGGSVEDVSRSTTELGNPVSLIMLIPVTILIFTAIKTRDIFKALSVGLLTGIVTGLLAGIFTFPSLFSSSGELGNNVTGFLPNGISYMMGTVTLVISVFGIMGILQAAGTMDRVVNAIINSRLTKTTLGTELAIALGACVTCVFYGGVTSAAILTFGPVADEAGTRKNIHPYRRANLVDGFVNSLPVVVPFLSAFVFISAALSGLSPVDVAKGLVYPVLLFLTLLVAVLTGWGLRYEGDNGEQQKTYEKAS